MALADQLGIADPNTMMNDIAGQTAPDVVSPGGYADPSMLMDRLLRKTTGPDGRPVLPRALQPKPPAPPQAAPDFSQFGQTKEQIDATPVPDFSQFGQEASAQKPEQEQVGGALSVAGREAAQSAIGTVGKAVTGAARSLNDITPTMVATAGGEGIRKHSPI